MNGKWFMNEDFLLDSSTARELYRTYAAPLPIIDYHCHLSPADIARDRKFENLTMIWLAGDHYKWRAMRTAGVDERFITGDASDWEKFLHWAETVPKTLCNPLYHWTHLELKRPFGIRNRLLSPSTARGIWEECNALLATPPFTARGLLEQMHVEVVCTTDDPADTLEFHRALAAEPGLPFTVVPAFRADKVLAVERPADFLAYLDRLGQAAGLSIRRYDDLLQALQQRHDFFHLLGCRVSDHGLETFAAVDGTAADAEGALRKLLNGTSLAPAETESYRSALLHDLAVMDWKAGWVQQFHLGALRNVNSRGMKRLGPDAGYDTVGAPVDPRALAGFLDRLDRDNRLAKTILYNLNPADNEVFASMIGNFQDGSAPGKLQYGAAWWFLDQQDGMQKQLTALSALGLLSQFVGMLTDSRSFLSYPRHEYFRRLLCNMLGADMERGLLPNDLTLIGGMIADICYHNASRYFGFPGRAAGPGAAD